MEIKEVTAYLTLLDCTLPRLARDFAAVALTGVSSTSVGWTILVKPTFCINASISDCSSSQHWPGRFFRGNA